VLISYCLAIHDDPYAKQHNRNNYRLKAISQTLEAAPEKYLPQLPAKLT
jgi:hypothetical protein